MYQTAQNSEPYLTIPKNNFFIFFMHPLLLVPHYFMRIILIYLHGCLLEFRITRLLDPITSVAMVTSVLRQQYTVWHCLLLRKPLFSSSQIDEKLSEVAPPAPESCKFGTWLRNNRAPKAWLVLLNCLKPKVICWVVLNDSAFKNGWDIVVSKIFRHKQGSNEQKTKIIQREFSKLWTNYLKIII